MVRALAVSRTIQVHYMDPTGAKGAVTPQEFPRADGVARFLGEVTLRESHAVSVGKVDGWDELHA
jgi:hypothetical protein